MARAFDTFARGRQILGQAKIALPANAPCPLNITRAESLIKIVSDIASGDVSLGLVPAAKTTAKDAWWPLLLSRGAGKVKITGLVGGLYALEQDERPFMFDRSVVAFATSGPVSPTWLKMALQKHEVPFFKLVDSTAAAGGIALFLVELSQKIVNDRDKVFSLDTELNGVKLKFAGLLGGYNIVKQGVVGKVIPLSDQVKALG